jgi:septum formation protein
MPCVLRLLITRPGGVSPRSHSIQAARSLEGSGGGRSMVGRLPWAVGIGSPVVVPLRHAGGVARRLVLASASPARLALLRAAGFAPEVVVSGVPEDDVTGPAQVVAGRLAERKTAAVADRLAGQDALVVGGDSVLDVDGEVRGKPADLEQARAWWDSVAGRSATLHSGLCVIDVTTGRRALGCASATVFYGTPTPQEMDAYLATGEPLHVAGGFTIDGYAAPFVKAIIGDPSTVLGLSLPLFRDLVAQHDTSVVELWA